MNKLLSFISITTIVPILNGCSTFGSLHELPDSNQKTVYQNGISSVISFKQNIVMISPTSNKIESGKRGTLMVSIKNRTNNDLLFSTQNIHVYEIINNIRTELKVYTYEELVKEEKRRQAWAALAAGLSAAGNSMQAANAGYSNTYGTYSGSSYGSNGVSSYGYGTYSSSTYDYGAAQVAQQQANAQNAELFDKVHTQGQANLAKLNNTILKKQTVFPNTWYGGKINMDLPELEEKPIEIEVDIAVGSEVHHFKFKYEKEKT